MNCGELNACPTDMSDCGSPPAEATAVSPLSAGGRRTRSDTGIIRTAASAAMICIEVRQS